MPALPSQLLCSVLVVCLLFVVPLAMGATDPSAGVSGGKQSSVVARVGGLEISASYLRYRYEQRGSLRQTDIGQDTPRALQRFLFSVVIPEAQLVSERLQHLQLPTGPSRKSKTVGSLSERILAARMRELQWEKAASSTLSEADVRAYYQANQRLFRLPRAHRLARILVSSQKAALRLVQEYQSPKSRPWRVMARTESLDEATRMRGGDLGFVFPNGHTHRPQVRVDPGLFAAADKLGQNGLVSSPVREASYYAVLRRIGSRPEQIMALQTVRDTIEMRVREQVAARRMRSLVAKLRKAHLRRHESANLRKLTSVPRVMRPMVTGGERPVLSPPSDQIIPERPDPPRPTSLGLR